MFLGDECLDIEPLEGPWVIESGSRLRIGEGVKKYGGHEKF